MIKVTINNLWINFEADHSQEDKALFKLTELLSLPAKGRDFSPKYKAYLRRDFTRPQWDGTIKFMKKNTIPTGLYPYAYKFLKNFLGERFMLDISDNRINVPLFREELITSFGGIELMEHQINIIKKANRRIGGLPFPRGLIDAAPNSGKTLMAMFLYLNIIDCKMLFIVPTRVLLEQTYETFSKLLPAECVGYIGEGETHLAPLTVGIVDSTSIRIKNKNSLSDHISKYFNVLIVDECHRAMSKKKKKKEEAGDDAPKKKGKSKKTEFDTLSMYETIAMKVNAGGRYYISGTPFGNKDNEVDEFRLMSQSSNVIYKVTQSYLIEKGISRKPVIYLHLNAETGNYSTMKEEEEHLITLSKYRAVCIGTELARFRGRKSIVSFRYRKQGEYIKAVLQEMMPDLRIACLDGRDSYKRRFEVLQDFRNGDLEVLEISFIGKEGMDLPNIDFFYDACGSSGTTTIVQFSGRAVRRKEGSTNIEIHSFFDVGHYLTERSKKRIAVYLEENFEIVAKYPCDENYVPTCIY